MYHFKLNNNEHVKETYIQGFDVDAKELIGVTFAVSFNKDNQVVVAVKQAEEPNKISPEVIAKATQYVQKNLDAGDLVIFETGIKGVEVSSVVDSSGEAIIANTHIESGIIAKQKPSFRDRMLSLSHNKNNGKYKKSHYRFK